MSVSTIIRRFPPKPESYREFVERAKRFVVSKGFEWCIPLDSEGTPKEGYDWDLRRLTGSHARTASKTNGFAVVGALRDQALAAGWNPAALPQGAVLSEEVQDFIKAVIALKCELRREPRATRHEARVYRKLFSVTSKAPWELSTEDFDRFLSLRLTDTKVADITVALAKTMNENLLSINCPLRPQLQTSLHVRLAASLTERNDAEKLPDKTAFYELTRIVFQETPRSHHDCVRFCAIRLLILTGLRLNEVLTLPSDCLRWESCLDVVTGRPAGEVGGTSETLRLRYFAEKHEEGGPDVLVEEHQWVPLRFQRAVAEAVEMVLRETQSLRAVLAEQHLLPQGYPRSDLRRFKTTRGEELNTANLLFLVPVGRIKVLPAEIPHDEAIAPISAPGFYQAICGTARNRVSTLFSRYGRSEEVHSMGVKPHSLRHMLNTEFFRLRLPDTIITQQFGRQTVAQSYQYDHRTLAERMAFVRLPDSASRVIRSGQPEELVAKMVVSGNAEGSHVGRTFKVIQAEHGDEAAFIYLAANSDGFHITPYGFCTNSFSVNPCARHLKCFDGCKHFAPSGLSEHKTMLEQLRVKLIAMKTVAESRPVTTLGRKNQIGHAERLIAGVEAALAAQPGTTVFPDGEDHSSRDADLFQ